MYDSYTICFNFVNFVYYYYYYYYYITFLAHKCTFINRNKSLGIFILSTKGMTRQTLALERFNDRK